MPLLHPGPLKEGIWNYVRRYYLGCQVLRPFAFSRVALDEDSKYKGKIETQKLVRELEERTRLISSRKLSREPGEPQVMMTQCFP